MVTREPWPSTAGTGVRQVIARLAATFQSQMISGGFGFFSFSQASL